MASPSSFLPRSLGPGPVGPTFFAGVLPLVYGTPGTGPDTRFPQTPVLDNFNRPPENPLSKGGLWDTAGFDGTAPLQTNGTRAQSTAANGTLSASAWASTVAPPLEIYVDVPAIPGVSTQFLSLVLATKSNGTGVNGYYVRFRAADWIVQRVLNDSGFNLIGPVAMTLSAGDSVGATLDQYGRITVWQKTGGAWTVLGRVRDIRYLIPLYPGLRVNDTSVLLDNFGAGSTGAFPVVAPQLPRSVGPAAVGPTFFAPLQPRTGIQTPQLLSATVAFTGQSNNATAKALPAGLSFSGASQNATTKALKAGLSFTGTLPKATARTLVGGLSFMGSLFKQTAKTAFTAVLSFTGTLRRQTGKAIVGGLSFAGSIPQRAITRTLPAAGLSFTGSLTKSTGRTLVGGLSFTGGIIKRTGKLVAGGLSFTGAQIKAITRTLAAAGLSFTGATFKALTRTLPAAVLSFTGTFISNRTYLRTFTAALSFTGTQTRQTTKLLTAGLSFSGQTLKALTRSLAGGLSFVGQTTKQTVKTAFAAGVGFVGSMSRNTARQLSAGLSFTGSWTRQWAHKALLTASVGFSGALQTSLSHLGNAYFVALYATLSFAGTTEKTVGKTFAATLSFAGSILPKLWRFFPIPLKHAVRGAGRHVANLAAHIPTPPVVGRITRGRGGVATPPEVPTETPPPTRKVRGGGPR